MYSDCFPSSLVWRHAVQLLYTLLHLVSLFSDFSTAYESCLVLSSSGQFACLATCNTASVHTHHLVSLFSDFSAAYESCLVLSCRAAVSSLVWRHAIQLLYTHTVTLCVLFSDFSAAYESCLVLSCRAAVTSLVWRHAIQLLYTHTITLCVFVF